MAQRPSIGAARDEPESTARNGTPRARVIAFYLPQFHPVPENDAWWGPGFTEWTNVAAARRLYPGHDQPHLPGELGFYDLRLPETRAAQAELASVHGVEAFCYWHYWFGGRRLLERPITEVLELGEPRLPFCLGWANGSWTGIWHGSPDRVLIEQTYPGQDDHDAHLDHLLEVFADDRYLTVDGCPLLFVLRPFEIPDVERVTERWRERASRAGFPGLFLVATARTVAVHPGFDASVTARLPPHVRARPRWRRYADKALRLPTVYRYDDVLESFVLPPEPGVRDYPCVFPNWDNTPRSGRRGVVLAKPSPRSFSRAMELAIGRVADRPPEDRLVWVKSWNEWAEGNYLEPDRDNGRAMLEALRDVVMADQ